MENKLNLEQKTVPTQKFEFNLNAISLEDLKTLYKHFQIEEFEDMDQVNNLESFFKCFVDGETDGNKDAFLLIRLAAILANDCARVLDCEYKDYDGKLRQTKDLFVNAKMEVDFDACDYYDFNPDGFHIMLPIYDYAIESVLPLMKNYNFLQPISYAQNKQTN